MSVKSANRPKANFQELMATRGGLTAREVADGLGQSLVTIRRRIKDKTFESFTVGTSRLIKPGSVRKVMGEK